MRHSKPRIDVTHKAVELEFWNSIKDSDTADMLEACLEKFPDGEFRRLAEIKLAACRKGSAIEQGRGSG